MYQTTAIAASAASDEQYTVTFSQNVNNALLMIDGDLVTLDLFGWTYLVGELTVGEHLGKIGELIVANGDLIVSGKLFARIGKDAGSEGELIVPSSGTVSFLMIVASPMRDRAY